MIKIIIITILVLMLFLLPAWANFEMFGKTEYIDSCRDLIEQEIDLSVSSDFNKFVAFMNKDWLSFYSKNKLVSDKENERYIILEIEGDEENGAVLIFGKKEWEKFVDFVIAGDEEVQEILDEKEKEE